jgi:23S rRNA pseudouridine1911/1915/1917 synthase
MNPTATKIEAHIIAEDENFVALNKPSGLLTIPDREGKDTSLKQLLKNKYGEIFTVHRIDKDTSGIVIFARNEMAHKHFSQQFENRETTKIYMGLVLGSPAEKAGTINEPIAEHPNRKGLMTVYRKGKESITEYAVEESFGLYSWVRFRILTGRTHQIRVHMKHIGHPIVCDELYGDGKPLFISQLKHRYKLSQSEEEERPLLNRLALHAYQLTVTGLKAETISLEAPLPKDLKASINQLNKWKK